MKFLKRIGRLSLFIVWVVLTINIISIFQEYHRDKSAVVIPLKEREEVYQTDVSGLDNSEVLELMIGDLLEESDYEEESDTGVDDKEEGQTKP